MDVVPPLSVLSNSGVSSGAVTGLTVAILFLVLLSAFFSAAESAYSFCNKIRLKNLESSGSKSAAKVLKQLENYDSFINTVLIWNNIINLTAASLSTVLFAKLISNDAVSTLLSTVVMTFLVVLFSEILPKSLAKEAPERFAMFAQRGIDMFRIILLPVSWIFMLWRKIVKPKRNKAVKEDELITIVEVAENEGEIDENESQLIRSAIEFDDVDVADIMVPRVNIVAVRDDELLENIEDAFVSNGFSRLPVYHESIDAIVGIIHEKDFYSVLRGKNELPAIIKSGICLSGNMKISDALRMLQKAKVHMAVVVDEFGGTSGIITMEDILEELVGEIYDEHDDEEEDLFKIAGDNTYIVSGEENLEDMFEKIGVEIREEFDSTSVGGWVTEQMKKIPLPGESFEYKNITVTVNGADARRVLEIKVEINDTTAQAN